MSELGAAVNDLPLLKFGMTGFCSTARQQVIDAARAMPQITAVWRVSSFSSADCWLVCGEKTLPVPAALGAEHTTLRVSAGLPTEHARTLHLPDIDRPLAFSVPLCSNDITPQLAFNLASPRSMHRVFKQFQECMRPTLARFALGRQLARRESGLQAAVYHVMHRGKLLAVFDFIAWRIGFLPTASLECLEHAVWHKRPVLARAIPEHFLPTDVAQLRWTYAQLTTLDVLPARYKNGLIYFRQPPSVPLAWQTDSQLLVLQELSMRPADMQTLVQRTGLALEQLGRDLACLYFAGSLTTHASNAAQANAIKRTSENADTNRFSRNFGNAFDSSLPVDERALTTSTPTVPAQLR